MTDRYQQRFGHEENIPPGCTTDRTGDGACALFQKHHERPFFLFVSFPAPHGPLQPKPEVAADIAETRNLAVS